MAHADLRHGVGMGPLIVNDVDAYTKPESGSTLVDPGGGGDPYLELDNSWSGSALQRTGDAFTLDHRFFLFSIYFDGTLTASQTQELVALSSSTATRFKLKQNTDTTHFNFVLRYNVTDYQGATDLATGAWHTILVEHHGPRDELRFFIWNGSSWDEEIVITGATAAPTGNWGWRDHTTLGASQKIRYKLCDSSQSDNRDAAPDGNVAIVASHPNGDGTYDAYGDHTNCGTGQTGGTYAHWDDWAGGTADDATTYNCENGSEGGAITSDFPSTTVPSGFYGITARAIGRGSLAAKTVGSSFRITDGTNDVDKANVNMGTDVWVLKVVGFARAPDGTAWTQAQWNGTELGVVSDSANGANDQWTALGAELVGVGNSTLPVIATGAGDMRLKQVV